MRRSDFASIFAASGRVPPPGTWGEMNLRTWSRKCFSWTRRLGRARASARAAYIVERPEGELDESPELAFQPREHRAEIGTGWFGSRSGLPTRIHRADDGSKQPLLNAPSGADPGREALGLSARRRRGVRIQRKAIGVANRTPVFGKYRLCSEG